ncbi:FAD-dependent oxidoreductase [Deinococcus sp.]|uniref:NAD(P)/FAD-dependent oxidoreductase n=1 Tax=Deinococcus sp. TaxID=47478 RepID=UPI0025E23A62|nr:FAD-dependent oxidoreductase [Deinococcus sp.]
MKLLVIGGGMAGASVAYCAAQCGLTVTLLDAGSPRSSDVPAALLNPVRGQSGSAPAQSLDGLRCTWALIAELEQAGFSVPHGQTGVLRPVPDARTERKWRANLPGELTHTWRDPEQPGWHRVLEIPEGGWVSGAALVKALKMASGAALVRGQATAVTSSSVRLATGEVLSADLVVCCGGSAGAGTLSPAGTHRAGSLLLLDQAPIQPLSFGAYLSPGVVGGVLGATYEAPATSHAEALARGLPLRSLSWLLDKGSALTPLSGTRITGRWTGVRLSPLNFGPDEQGVWHLSGLGSKGFLLGPLLARALVESLLTA